MADIIIVRHGTTAWNVEERFRGHACIHLDNTGIRQAYATAERIAKLSVAVIYSSPVNRAMETADIIAKVLGLEVKPLAAITDINFGKLEGLSFKEAEERYADILWQWWQTPHLLQFPGGESLDAVKVRASIGLDDIIKRLVDESVVFVSHKVVISMLILHFLGMKISHFRQIGQDTCAINIFQKQGKHFYATLLNDTCHLRGMN